MVISLLTVVVALEVRKSGVLVNCIIVVTMATSHVFMSSLFATYFTFSSSHSRREGF